MIGGEFRLDIIKANVMHEGQVELQAANPTHLHQLVKYFN